MMCNRLYLEAVDRALQQIGKVYMKRVAGIEKKPLSKSTQLKKTHLS